MRKEQLKKRDGVKEKDGDYGDTSRTERTYIILKHKKEGKKNHPEIDKTAGMESGLTVRYKMKNSAKLCSSHRIASLEQLRGFVLFYSAGFDSLARL